MTNAFWISFFIVFYAFAGYGLLLYFLIKIKRAFKGKLILPAADDAMLPACTLVVAAYNEALFIQEKIVNTLHLNYPSDKLKLLFITDGSTDQTPQIIRAHQQIKLLHDSQRSGKIAAIHRAMAHVDTEVVVFTDANTFLNRDALKLMCRHYSDNKVGAVAGEKRLVSDRNADAAAAGEGFYWKYESVLKKWDSELYSVVGAAGELFSIRRSLYQDVPADTILDDFMISMLIAKKGYRILYEAGAYALETGSENITEELKRKIRIAAGGIQSVIRLNSLFNIFRYPVLSFQYISHRVLRWTVTPFLLIVIFVLNAMIVIQTAKTFYILFMAVQVMFYLLALSGFIMEKRRIRVKALFIPFYFCVMNYAVLMGIIRYFSKKQSAVWDKASRKMIS